MTSNFYVAYGFTIQSDYHLPELRQFPRNGDRVPDITIVKGDERFTSHSEVECEFAFTAETATLLWPQIGSFHLVDNSTLVVHPIPGAAEEIIRLPLLGPVLALLLHRKGYFVLHASGVAISPSTGIGFLGDKGAGKSTTAAAFLRDGSQLIADDVLSIAIDPSPRMVSGFPQMKLTNASFDAVELTASERLPAIDIPGFDKRKHLVAGHFSDDAVAARRLYLLERGEALSVRPLSERESFQMLLRFSYLARFGNAALQGPRAQPFFEQCATLGRLNMVSRLTVPHALDRLQEVVDLVQDDLGRGAS